MIGDLKLQRFFKLFFQSIILLIFLSNQSFAQNKIIEFRVNQGSEGNQHLPVIAQKNDTFIVAWSNDEDDHLFFQRFDFDGNSLDQGIDQEILDDQIQIGWNVGPAIDILEDGRFIAVWHDGRGTGHVYGQYFDSDGSKIDTNFQISDLSPETPRVAIGYPLDVAECMTTWVSRIGTDADTYFRWQFDFLTQPTPGSIQIDPEGDGPFDGEGDVAWGSTHYSFAWSFFTRDPGANTFIKFNGIFGAEPLKFPEPTSAQLDDAHWPSITGFNNSTNTFLTWRGREENSTDWEIYARLIAGDNTVLATIDPVSQNATVANISLDKSPDVTNMIDPNGNDYFIIIVWTTASTTSGLYGRLFEISGDIPVEGAFQNEFVIASDVNHDFEDPVVASYEDRFMIAWKDNRNDSGDIYASIWSIDIVAPSISDPNDNLDPDAKIYDNNSDYVTTVTTSVEDLDARVNSGMESVYLVYEITDPWGYTYPADSVLMGPPAQQNPPPPPSSYHGDLPMPYDPGSEIWWFIRARDVVDNVSRHPIEPERYHGPIYVRELGDLNGDGCYSNVDLA